MRDVDWIEQCWPRDLVGEVYRDRTPRYPKIQYYFLTGVRGAFTNFHVDFGGSSGLVRLVLFDF